MNQKKIRQAKTIDNVFGSAHWHLNQRDLSIGELTEKLTNKTDNAEWISTVIDDCIDKGYLKSDERFAEGFIRNAVENGSRGVTWIRNKLKEKKVSEVASTQAIEDADYNYKEVAAEYLGRKFEGGFKGKNKTQVTRQLVSRGFSMSDANFAIRKHPHCDELDISMQNNQAAPKKQKDAQSIVLKLFRAGKGGRFIQQQLSISGHRNIDIQAIATENELDFYESAATLAEKRTTSKRLNLKEYADKNKLKAYLVSRGFSFEEIDHAIESVTK